MTGIDSPAYDGDYAIRYKHSSLYNTQDIYRYSNVVYDVAYYGFDVFQTDKNDVEFIQRKNRFHYGW